MKSLSKFWVLALLICGAGTATAQSSLKDDEAQKATEVKNIVNSGRYTFEATKMVTGKGESMPVSYGTDIDISKDTLITYLPDAGKAPGTPVTAHAPGITCIHFGYIMTPGNNGGWDVTITPEDRYAKGIKKVSMHITKEGYATVNVATTDRGRLEYYGYIMQHEAMFPGARIVAANY